MNNLIKSSSELVKAAWILSCAAVIITALVLMYASGVLQQGGWVFLLFAGLIAYNFLQRR